MNINPDQLASTLKLIVGLLVDRNFERLEELSGGERLSAVDLRGAVDRYPFTLQYPPGGDVVISDRGLGVIEIESSHPQRWAVDLDLWDDSGERSDLTLQLTIMEGSGNLYAFTIDDLHVL